MKRLLFILSFALYLNINAQIITTVAGNGTQGFSGDGGQATAAELYSPSRITFDATGNMYIVDRFNSRIRKVNTAGVITTIAGNGIAGFNGDGGQATNAELNNPWEVIVDATGNFYIADANNSRIRKVNTSGVISTIAGSGSTTYSGDGGQATDAGIEEPFGMAIDANGNLFIADWGDQRIRKVNTSGIITTIAGTGGIGFSGDGGQATAAQLRGPTQVVVDAGGNVFILDTDNNRIRKVNTSGVISTVAGIGWTGGNCYCGYSGDGGQATDAELNYPFGITFDAAGKIYVADFDNYCVRMINTSGIISTIVGDTTEGFSGDGGQASAARLDWPRGVALDASGNLYIADEANNRIRKVTNVATTGISQYSNLNSQISIYPNPSTGIFTIGTNISEKQNMQIFDVNGKVVLSQTITDKTNIDASALPAGIYNVSLSGNEGITNKRLVIAK